MPKSASSIQVRELHRREYQRTMRYIVLGSVVLWTVLAVILASSDAAGGIVPMSIILLIGLAATRIAMWSRYRRDMRAELKGYD